MGKKDPDIEKLTKSIADGTSTHPIMDAVRSQAKEGARLDIQDYGDSARVNIIGQDGTETSYAIRKNEYDEIKVKKEGNFVRDE